MQTANLLSILRERDVRLWIEEDRLRCSAPQGALTPDLKAALASRRDEIIAVLKNSQGMQSRPNSIVPLKPDGRRPPLFAIPGHNGDVFCYVALARHLDADQPLLGLQPPGLDGSEPLRSIETLARFHVEHIRQYRPEGPYLIAGYCAGGTIAFEVARQLTEQGQGVELLALLGAPFPTFYRRVPQAVRLARWFVGRVRHHGQVLISGTLPDAVRYLRERARHHQAGSTASPSDLDGALLASQQRVEKATLVALRHYRPRRFVGEVDIVLPADAWRTEGTRTELWGRWSLGMREHIGVDNCPHDMMLKEPHVAAIANALALRLQEAARLEEARNGVPA